jgi:CBS domain-containing protein
MRRGVMGFSEFDDAYEDDTALRGREDQRLGAAILNSTIRSLEPHPAICVREETTIHDAIRLMLDREIGAVLVEREGHPVGIFTERDVLRRVATTGIDQRRPVTEVMTSDPRTLSLDDGIAFALNLMIVEGFRHIPILDNTGRAQTVLSLREVVAFMVSQLPARVLNLPPEPGLEARSTNGG